MTKLLKKKDVKLGHHKVEIIESERGWGSKVDEILYFKTEAEAKKYVAEYNAKYNNEPTTPDWYMIAKYAGEVK
jgi:hypothetical protein